MVRDHHGDSGVEWGVISNFASSSTAVRDGRWGPGRRGRALLTKCKAPHFGLMRAVNLKRADHLCELAGRVERADRLPHPTG